ncbi:MAG: Mpo1-like protein [Bacteroidota bacterium]
MRTAEQWFTEYGESHQTAFNKMIHYVCVPAIFFSIVGLLASIPLGGLPGMFPPAIAPFVHLGTALIIFGLVFYARMSFPIFVGMLLISAVVLYGNYWLAANFSTPLWLISVIIFVVAWVLQFIGHNHEGKKPSFLKDLQFLMIGPAWILGHLYKKMGIGY